MDQQRSTDTGPVKMDQVAEVLRENQKLITLGRLAASIAHEINNPLESITNLLYLIEQGKPEDAGEYLKLAQRELSRVAQISKQTLTFSRETSGPVRVQLPELIEEVLGLHARKIGDKNLRVVRQYETHDAVTVFPGEMRQVFSNLISNAIEATAPRGRIVIRIRGGRRWSGRDGRGLRLSIGDNGSGIPESVRVHLGKPFFTTKGQSGTGLGLWVTQSIVNRYGGGLQLRSATSSARHGTVFSLFLPLNVRPVTVFPGSEADDATATRRWRGLRLIRQEDANEGIPDKPSPIEASEKPPALRLAR
jgi:signal transduction histidine kinase